LFKLEDGRSCFWQWDLNRRIIINDDSITEVHYCNKTESCSLITEVYKENGINYSNVPNILLTTDWKINIYGYDKDYTKHSKCFKVNSRSKPADYIYTETEIKNYDALEARIKALEEKEIDINLSEYVKKTDYASTSKHGVVKPLDSWGTAVNSNGEIYIIQATNSQINAKKTPYNPITPANLDYAVKSVGNNIYATKSDIGNIEAALDAIIAIQNSFLGVSE
jgi:hypothetical protein